MTKPNENNEHTIDICHNGKVITVDYAGALGHARQHAEDIVPAFEDFPGQNIGESCSPETTTTTQLTPTSTTTVPSVTTTRSTPTTSVSSVTTTVLTDLTVTDSLPELSTTTSGPGTTFETSVAPSEPAPAPDMLPVTGLPVPGMIVVAGILIAAGVKLVRR